jgi:hypothetical protein
MTSTIWDVALSVVHWDIGATDWEIATKLIDQRRFEADGTLLIRSTDL